MEPQVPARVERRLAAILVMDVGGYSRLIEADEEGTLAVLKALRRELDFCGPIWGATGSAGGARGGEARTIVPSVRQRSTKWIRGRLL